MGHGEPLRTVKTSTYNGGFRIPLISRAPGRMPAGSSSDLVDANIDLLPMVAKRTDADLHDDRVIDGPDPSGIVHGTETELDRPFFLYQN